MVVFEKEGVRLKMTYDPAQFEPSVEVVSLTDKRLSNVWGDQVYRLSLNAKKLQLSGKYKITFSKN
jgi:hypothetical protein